MAEMELTRKQWGSVEEVKLHEGAPVQHFKVNPGGRLPLRNNKYHSEHWVVVKGVGRMHLENQAFLVDEGSSVYVPARTCHAIENLGEEVLRLVAVHYGSDWPRAVSAAE